MQSATSSDEGLISALDDDAAAAPYIEAVDGSCPSGTNRIADPSLCKIAAQDLGYDFKLEVSWIKHAKGCVLLKKEGELFFNKHSTGGISSFVTAVCIQDLTPAPTPVSPTQACIDTLGFSDEFGGSCSEWTGFDFDCSQASETFGYSEDGEIDLMSNCRTSCGLCEAPTESPTPSPTGTPTEACEDTPGFVNGHGHGCANYEKHWCANGAARQGKEWTLGSGFNFPQKNCCVCGKPLPTPAPAF